MTPNEFKEWRKSLGLTQKRAAIELEISEMSVKQYERGSRFDNGQPRPVPSHIIERCHLIAEHHRKSKPRFTLNFSSVTREERSTLIQKLDGFGLRIDPTRSVYFNRDYFTSVWAPICEWLGQNVPESAYLILHLGNKFEDGDAKVLLQFFEAEDAARFIVHFRDENDAQAMQCSIVAAVQARQAIPRAMQN